jgi:hypothetical protein
MNRYSIADRDVILPSGTYYIGDPCYVVPDEGWMQMIEETNYFNLFPSGDFRMGRRHNPKHLQYGVFLCHPDDVNPPYYMAVSLTAYGDGSFPCREDGGYIGMCEVDAGLIGVIPIEMIMSFNADLTRALVLGIIHDFINSFSIEYENGIITFGNITVDTTGDDCEY